LWTTLLKHLIDTISEIDDLRCVYKVEYNLVKILVMAICGVIVGAESWEDIALLSIGKSGKIDNASIKSLGHGV
jgi:hypothetical protein